MKIPTINFVDNEIISISRQAVQFLWRAKRAEKLASQLQVRVYSIRARL